jgi:hypothetical protein
MHDEGGTRLALVFIGQIPRTSTTQTWKHMDLAILFDGAGER